MEAGKKGGKKGRKERVNDGRRERRKESGKGCKSKLLFPRNFLVLK